MIRDEEDNKSEMSQRRNNTFSWSSTQSSIFTQFTLYSITEEDLVWNYLMLQGYLSLNTDQERRVKMIEMVCRLASQGNLVMIQQFMVHERTRAYVQLDAVTEEEHWTPLMYASCFGKSPVARYLLERGVKVDAQDKLGWTPLMWAVINGHCDVVEILLEYNASLDINSTHGSTVYDLVNTTNERMMQHFQRPNTVKESQFMWDQCLPDQMFVFSEDQLDIILNVAITNLKLPTKSRSEIYVPANILFLCARYAHYYYSTNELVDRLLVEAIQRIKDVIQSNKRDVHTLAFWISNLTHLLYYLKKDTALVASAAEHQLLISELVSKAYTALIDDSQKRLDYILESAMLEFEPLDGFDVIHFAHDWQRFFFRRSSSSAFVETISSPTSVTHLLSSILYVLQSYEVHPTIIHQALSQLFHFFSCEMFNRILSNKRMLCRSKALQIRMNLTVIEEWARQQGLTIESHLVPVIQMVQLLQCVSQLTDLVDFIHTIKSFDLLNPIQIKRLIVQYRYEVNERRVPEEIEKYTMQIAEDTIKQYVQEKKTSRNNSMSSLMYEEEEGRVKEKKDSTYMLPFSLPTLISEKVIPVIPEDWLMKLTPLFSP
ncbi:hypothetical protein G6F43_011142 [Rhizopus delemar]|nr:hypothetical protein G6F43_011142 [Rhizopus delemar]